ncbi:MAG: hypothetical protein C0397_15220 [Odoribacter sp.]|nr:hypothetical protein [Odoribacter sp.]
MKQLNIFLFVFVLSLITTQAIAQQEKNRKWELAFSYGLATPVGSFSKVIPEKSFAKDDMGKESIAFTKEGHGAAKNGRFLSAELSYCLKKHWFVSLIATQSNNTVDTKPMLEYVNKVTRMDFNSLTNNDYRVNSLALGFGYRYQVKKLGFQLIPILGRAEISKPDYSFTFSKIYPIDFSVFGKQNSFLLGVNSRISYQLSSRFSLALKMGYNAANFKYVWISHSPGVDPFRSTDVINYRLIQTGITLGFKLM